VSYTWRNSPEATLRVKGAYIIKVSMWGRDFCAGVGYSVLPPWGDMDTGQSQPTGVPTGGCSRAAAIDAADGLRRRLIDRAEHARVDVHGLGGGESGSGGGGGGGSGGGGVGREGRGGPDAGGTPDPVSADALGGLRRSTSVVGGEPSELPPPLAAILRDHTLLHINALQHAGGGTGGAPSAENGLSARTPAASAASSSVSPQVAALIGYDRRRRGDTPLNGRVAALVGYGRRHHAPVPLERRGSDA
jgi:hypothetical protein